MVHGSATEASWTSDFCMFLWPHPLHRAGVISLEEKIVGVGVIPSQGCCPCLLFFWEVIFSLAELAAGRVKTANYIRNI